MSDQDKLQHEAGTAGATVSPDAGAPGAVPDGEALAEATGRGESSDGDATSAAGGESDPAPAVEPAESAAAAGDAVSLEPVTDDAAFDDGMPGTEDVQAPDEPVPPGAEPDAGLVGQEPVAEVSASEAVAPVEDAEAANHVATGDEAGSAARADAGLAEVSDAAAATDEPLPPIPTDAAPETEAPAEPAVPTVDPQLKAIIEALVFASPDPLTTKAIGKVLEGEPRDAIEIALESLKQDYARAGGLQLVEVAGGFQIVTRPDLHEWVRRLFHERTTQKLSVAALETLAVIAYKQPITSAEIADVRGVNTSGVLGTLIDRKLVKIVGRKQVVGRPFMYATTREFLNRFGLRDLNDLPKVEDMADALGFDPPSLDDVATAAALPFDLDAPAASGDAAPAPAGVDEGPAGGDE